MKLVYINRQRGDKSKEAESWFKYSQALFLYGKPVIEIETGCKNAAALYVQINDKKSEIDVLLQLALCRFQYNLRHSVEQDLLDILKKPAVSAGYRLPDIYFYLSAVNRYKGNFNKALDYALRSQKYMEAQHDTARSDNFFGEIAQVYELLDKPVESAFWYKKCLKKRESLGSYPQNALYRTYGMLVVQLLKTGSQREAFRIMKNLSASNPPEGQALGSFFQSMAYCYDARGAIDSAKKYYASSLDIYSSTNANSEVIAIACYDLAKFYVKQGAYKDAAPYINKMLPIAVSSPMIAGIRLLQFKIDSAGGRYSSAIRHLQQYNSMNDSMFNATKSKQIEELQIQYETNKKNSDLVRKDQDISLLKKNSELQKVNLRQAKAFRNIILASALLLVVLLVLAHNRYRLKQRTNIELEAQQKLINQKNVSLQQLVNEKDWLVKEIHHRVKNNFHIVMGLLGTQSGYLQSKEAVLAMQESQQRVHAMSLIHQKLYQSENLSAINMPDYIHELVEYLKDSLDTRRRISFLVHVDRVEMDLSYSVPVGLILNEAITNAIKYGFAGNRTGNIWISLLYTDENKMLLTIADNGAGLPAGFDLEKRDTMGINLMKGLTEDLGGTFLMQNMEGARITIAFTYDPDMAVVAAPLQQVQNVAL
ncbi:MAG: sensor histidine kinase [Chitinophagaceae bacterium]